MRGLLDADITKTCNVCKKPKTLDNYNPNKACKYGVVGTCKPCSQDRVKGWYSKNRAKRQEAANLRNRGRKDLAISRFGNQCFDCKNSYPRCVYQFHHLDPTKKDVNPSAAMTKTEDAMWEELSKCVMLCANCHMIRHHGEEEDARTS